MVTLTLYPPSSVPVASKGEQFHQLQVRYLLEMQNNTDCSSLVNELPAKNCVSTSVPSIVDHQIQAWQVAVPLMIVITTVLTGMAGLALAAYKIHRRQHSSVFPVSVRTSERESHQIEATGNGWTEPRSTILETTLTSVHDSDDELEITRTKSLSVLIPRGVYTLCHRKFVTPGNLAPPPEIDLFSVIIWHSHNNYSSSQPNPTSTC